MSANTQNDKMHDDTKVLQMLIDCGGSVASLRNELKGFTYF
jgi:hypothetical protein